MATNTMSQLFASDKRTFGTGGMHQHRTERSTIAMAREGFKHKVIQISRKLRLNCPTTQIIGCNYKFSSNLVCFQCSMNSLQDVCILDRIL